MATNFKYIPLNPEALSGSSFISQTEQAINELGDHMDESIERIETLADSAYQTAQDALAQSSDAVTIAQEALSSAQDAQSRCNRLEVAVDAAQKTADSAQARADSAHELAETAQGTADAAKEKADSAHEIAEEGWAVANTAQEIADQASSTASAALEDATMANEIYYFVHQDDEQEQPEEPEHPDQPDDMFSGDALFSGSDDEPEDPEEPGEPEEPEPVDLDKYINPVKLFLNEETVLNAPVETPLYFRVGVTEDYSRIVQECWRAESPDERYVRSGVITPVEIEDPEDPENREREDEREYSSWKLYTGSRTREKEYIDTIADAAIKLDINSPLNLDWHMPVNEACSVSVTPEPGKSKVISISMKPEADTLIEWTGITRWKSEKIEVASPDMETVVHIWIRGEAVYATGFVCVKPVMVPEVVTLVFDGNGADTIEFESIEVERGTVVLESDCPEVSREDHVFTGWHDEEGFPIDFSDFVAEDDVTIVAGWEASEDL